MRGWSWSVVFVWPLFPLLTSPRFSRISSSIACLPFFLVFGPKLSQPLPLGARSAQKLTKKKRKTEDEEEEEGQDVKRPRPIPPTGMGGGGCGCGGSGCSSVVSESRVSVIVEAGTGRKESPLPDLRIGLACRESALPDLRIGLRVICVVFCFVHVTQGRDCCRRQGVSVLTHSAV